MTAGEKARLWIPGKLAYGDTPAQPGMPAGMLVFDVELLDITAGSQAAGRSHRRQSRARQRQEDRIGPRLPRAAEGHRHPVTPARPIR